MTTDMRTFQVEVEIENPSLPGPRRRLSSVLVDTGAELPPRKSSRSACAGAREKLLTEQSLSPAGSPAAV